MKSYRTTDYHAQSKDSLKESIDSVILFGRRYSYLRPHSSKYDRKFVNITSDIEYEYKGIFYSKPDQVRIEQWVKKLCQDCCDKVPLLRNRNKYIKLLRMCVFDIKRLEGVFKKMPPSEGEDLRLIQNHEILDIEYLVQNSKKRKQSERRAKDLYNLNKTKARQERQNYLQKHEGSGSRNRFRDFMSNGSSVDHTPSNTYYKNLQKSIISIQDKSNINHTTIFSTTVSPINAPRQGRIGSIQRHASRGRSPPMSQERCLLQNQQRSKSLINLKAAVVPPLKTKTIHTHSYQSVQSTSRDEGTKSRRSRAERIAERSKSVSTDGEGSYQRVIHDDLSHQASQSRNQVQSHRNKSTEFTLAKDQGKFDNNIQSERLLLFQPFKNLKDQVSCKKKQISVEYVEDKENRNYNNCYQGEVDSMMKELHSLRQQTSAVLQKGAQILGKRLNKY